MPELLNRPRLVTLMEAQGLDAIVAATPPNVLYCSGMYSLGQWLMESVKAYAIVPRDPSLPTRLVLPISDVDLAAERGLSDIHFSVYGTFYVEPGVQHDQGTPGDSDGRLRELAGLKPAQDAQEALVRSLRDLDGTIQRIGVDERGMEPAALEKLSAALAGVEFVPASDLLIKTRMVKTPAEQARLKHAAHIAERGMMTVIDQLREGMSEREAQRIFESVLAAEGARPALTVIGFGPHSAYPNATPGDRQLRPGDVVRFDVGCIWQHYWSDLSRCAVFGAPSPRIQDYYEALVLGEDAAIEAVRPGVKASEVFDRAVQAVQEAGIPHYRRQHVGHGIGLEVYDPPILRPGVDTVLEPGMVLNVETPYYETGFAGLQIEDLVVVTETGCDLLTESERRLYIKGEVRA